MPYYPQTPGIYPYTTATAVRAIVALTTANVVLLAANANRRGGTIFNASVGVMQISLGGNSLSSPTLTIPSGGYYEIPFGWTGSIDGSLQAGTGNAFVAELFA